MHWIQRHILKELAFNDTRRYTELKPETVEGNLFQYHGRELEKQGLIVRSGEGYALTPRGSQFVADLSQGKAMNRKTPPRVVVMIVAANEGGEHLLFRWRRHPYRGMVSLPFGRQFAGMSSSEAAAEQLRYKSGYQAEFVFVGVVSLRTTTDHLLIQVFQALDLSGNHGSDGLTGFSLWSKIEDIDAAELLPGTREVVAWLGNAHRPGLLELDL